MEILQLRYFFDTANTGSFSKTAEKYEVSATSVSTSVKRLEKEFGCELFNRSCNRITLNDNGRQLQQSLYIIFDELSQVMDNLSAENTDTREIKILVRAIRSKTADYIIEYKANHPHVIFKTSFDYSETDYEKYDIIIDEGSNKYLEYENFELCRSHIRMYAASDNPLCGKKLTLKQLSDQPFISMDERGNLHRILINVCKKAGFAPNIVVHSNDLQCLTKFLEAGVGLALSREFPANSTANNISTLDVTDFNETQIIHAYFKKEAAYGNVKHFLNFLNSKAT